MNNSKRSGGLGFSGVLTVVFIVLRLVGIIDWSWLWILSPLWIDIGITIILVVVINLIDNRSKNKWNRSDRLKW